MPTSETIGVLGFSARAAAFSVLRAGRTPLSADAFADADLRRVAEVRQIARYPSGLADWLACQAADHAELAWLYTGGLENHPKLLSQMTASGRLLGNGPEVVRRVRSPFRLAKVLAEANLAMPATVRSPKGLPTDGSWLQKRRRSAGGHGVSPWIGGQARPGDYFQQRIDGVAASAVYVAHPTGAVCFGVTRQLVGEAWTGARGYAYCGSVGPWPVDDRLQTQIEKVGHVLATANELRGLFGVDFILSNETAWVVEINPRYTASIEVLERSHVPSAIDLHLAAFQGAPIPTPRTKTGCHGKAIVYASHDVLIDNRASEQLLAEAGDWQSPAWADIPPGGTAILAGHPVLTTFASGATCEEVEQRLQLQAKICRRRIEQSGIRSCS